MMDHILFTNNGIPFTLADTLLEYSYLLAAIMFVIGLKLQSKPDTARRGNIWAGAGMLLAILTTLFLHRNNQGNYISILNILIVTIVLVISSIVGIVIARKVKMTAMPQLVSFLNATGGAASALVALMEIFNPDNSAILVTLLGLAIGSLTFSGSMVAYGKLDGKIGDIFSPVMKYVNIFMLLLVIALIIGLDILNIDFQFRNALIFILLGVSLVYGVLFVMPIGGADMPVVISLLNSFSGLAAALAGFIYNNHAMILGGILVGAAGTILTILMCKAMNRSLLNVLIGAFGGGSARPGDITEGTIKEISLPDAAVLLSYSHRVVIIPGYGLAVAQAQHVCSELDKLLTNHGVQVKYAIHPVAGRMPGHMNVLLAEADVPYEKLVEMDEINPEMSNTDVAIVIGANDVVNPAAHDDPSSPIYGMPIVDAHEAKNIIVMKRGMGKGYAAIENNLFLHDKTRMLFGNAKDTLQKLVGEIKNL
jgi:NAD(P) transhydrogenase subunit beta